jgi:sirohydrochlorin ferrochelatase
VPPSGAPSDEGDHFADDLPSALARLLRDWESNAAHGWGVAGEELEKRSLMRARIAELEAKLATAVEALRLVASEHHLPSREHCFRYAQRALTEIGEGDG